MIFKPEKLPLLLIRFFRSIKLALALITYLVIASIAATFIPQGKPISFYSHEFSPTLYRIILAVGLNEFFRSILFLLPSALFFINLLVCTLYRIITRFKRRAKLRLGPDIIHLGLIVLMLAGILTLFGRREAFVFLAPGDSVKLPGGYELFLDSFKYVVYENGNPKEWISEVSYGKNGKIEGKYGIQVNKPLKLADLNIFQYSYKDLSSITLKGAKTFTMHPGSTIRIGDKSYRFMRIGTSDSQFVTVVGSEKDESNVPSENNLRVVFLIHDKDGHRAFQVFRVGERLGGFKIVNAVPRLETGLSVVKDPGFIPILSGLILVAFGLTLTFYQKLKDK